MPGWLESIGIRSEGESEGLLDRVARDFNPGRNAAGPDFAIALVPPVDWIDEPGALEYEPSSALRRHSIAKDTAVHKTPFVIPVVRDASLDSAPNGSPAIYWMSAELQQKLLGARGLKLLWNLLSMDGAASVRVVGRHANDGRSWAPFGYTAGGFVPQTLDGLANGIDELGSGSSTYAHRADDFSNTSNSA